MGSKNYDITFILPIPTYNIPPGGYDIVFQLAKTSNSNGFKTSIVFVNSKKYLVWNSIHTIFGNRRIMTFYKLVPILNRIRRVDYDYGILSRIDLYFVNEFSEVHFTSRTVIASGFSSASFALQFKEHQNSMAYYLIFHSEDHKDFSCNAWKEAELSYELPLKKIVTNKIVYDRFSAEKPYFLQLGYDDNKFKRIETIKKEPNSILIPLRKGRSKGAITGLRALQLLREKKDDLRFYAFGDFPVSEVPDYIKYKFRPTKDELIELYNRSMIFILPSIVEGFALPAIEAMACGCALISTMNGGSEEYAEDEINALMCPVNDPPSIADRVFRIISDFALLDRLVSKGMETARKYSISSTKKKFLEFLDTEM